MANDSLKAPLPFVPIIIIGAGRSGTNALREMICALPEFATWPCDEINPIWRHGNVRWPDDAIPPERATAPIIGFIRRQFHREWSCLGEPRFLVEKTCANALRVEFVDKILPEAKFIHIQRSCNAVVPSARKRWQGKMEIDLVPYLAAKARFTPLRDSPIYAWRFIGARIKKNLSRDRAFPVWGPRFEGMEQFREMGLNEACAAQWAECVVRATQSLAKIEDRVFTVRYEKLVAEPRKVLEQLLRFTGGSASEGELADAADMIREQSGKDRDPLPLDPRAQARVDEAHSIMLGR